MSKLIPKLICDVLTNHTQEHITPVVEEYARTILSKREEKMTIEPETPLPVESRPAEEEPEKKQISENVQNNSNGTEDHFEQKTSTREPVSF